MGAVDFGGKIRVSVKAAWRTVAAIGLTLGLCGCETPNSARSLQTGPMNAVPASGWNVVAETAAKTYAVETSSIVRSGNLRNFRLLANFDQSTSNPAVFSAIGYSSLYCDQILIQFGAGNGLSSRGGAGSQVTRFNGGNWIAIQPGSMEESLKRYV